MNSLYKPDFLIIGAGIVGLTVALQLKKQFPDSEIIIIEKKRSSVYMQAGGIVVFYMLASIIALTH